MHISVKNTKLKHAKRLGIFLGACVPFASKEWCQKEIAKFINEDEKILKIKIETVCHYKCSGRSILVCMTIDKEEEIREKIINVFRGKMNKLQSLLGWRATFDDLVRRKQGDLK